MSHLSTARRLMFPCLAAAVALVAIAGCHSDTKAPQQIAIPPKYAAQPPREVPAWLQGSILQQIDLLYTQPTRVSNYGLVALQRPTGDSQNIPNTVREYILNEMAKRNFGSSRQPGFENLSPQQALRSKKLAVVRVDAFIPPGARKGQRIDAQVTALPDTDTSSLATGSLYTTDLTENGADVRSPGGGVDVKANARGYVFVNPAYVLAALADTNDAGGSGDADLTRRRNLTQGLLLNGGRVNQPRPLGLRVRAAERKLSRAIEQRIQQLYSSGDAAHALDEGQIYIYMPAKFRDDWEHFAGVTTHTFFNASSDFAVKKSRELAAEMVKPNAPLLDLSYTVEALGRAALPEVESLMSSPHKDVAFAVARAAAWLGDGAAEAALISMARDPADPFRVSAVQTLSALPNSPSINSALRDLLGEADATVRVEAYKGLVANADPFVYSRKVGEKFIIDIVESSGPPLVYASRSGWPRIAFIGSGVKLRQPAFFTAMNNELSIADTPERKDLLTIFYRGNTAAGEPIKQISTPDLAELVARLGGEGPPGQPMLDFTYCDVVALLGKFSDSRMLVATGSGTGPTGTAAGTPVNFVLQSAPGSDRGVESAPTIPDEGPRPVDAPSTMPAEQANSR